MTLPTVNALDRPVFVAMGIILGLKWGYIGIMGKMENTMMGLYRDNAKKETTGDYVYFPKREETPISLSPKSRVSGVSVRD